MKALLEQRDAGAQVSETDRVKPFFSETVVLLNAVRDHDFPTLATACDDDFGIVDIDAEGGSQVFRNRTEWEGWFTGLFHKLSALKADTWSQITRYEAVATPEMGYSVVDFDQFLVLEGQRLKFHVLATLIWKKVNNRWVESRYHSSLLSMGPDDGLV